MTAKLLSVPALLALVAALVYLAMQSALFGTGPATIALQVAAFLLMIWARITFGMRSFHAAANPTEGGLVRTGPYHYVRHPIYAAILLFFLGALAAHPSWRTAAAGVAVLAMLLVRILTEERLVTLRYPEYAEYARTTKRLVPGVY